MKTFDFSIAIKDSDVIASLLSDFPISSLKLKEWRPFLTKAAYRWSAKLLPMSSQLKLKKTSYSSLEMEVGEIEEDDDAVVLIWESMVREHIHDWERQVTRNLHTHALASLEKKDGFIEKGELIRQFLFVAHYNCLYYYCLCINSSTMPNFLGFFFVKTLKW